MCMVRKGHPVDAVDETLSVIICTYNNAGLLERTLGTLEAQEACAGGWSVLIVNNNSTDATVDVIEAFRQRGRIPGLRRVDEHRQGLAYARRRAVAESRAPWLAFVDDDCLLDPDWVDQALRFIQQQPEAGGFGGRVIVQWEIAPPPIIERFATSYAAQDHGDQILPVLEGTPAHHLVGAGLILNRRALEACGWLESMALTGRRGTSLAAGEDTEIVFRIRNAGYTLWYSPALRMRHFISRRRMTLEYLCRMQRGFGQSRPITRALRFNQPPRLAYRARVFLAHLGYFLRLMKSVICDHWLARRALSPEQKVGFHFRLGQLEGAWTFLRRGYHV